MARHKYPKDRIPRLVVFIVIACMGVMGILACRGMYADGANMLVHMLEDRNFLLFEHHRIFHALLTQAPAVLMLKLGVTNLGALRMVYSGALIFWPLLFWGLALFVVREDVLFWPLALMFSVVYANTGFFSISESNLCFALTACCLACMLKPGPLVGFDRKLLMVAAVLYPLEYAATLFLGPILCLLALYLRLKEPEVEKRRYWKFLALMFFLSFVTGVWEVLTPRDPSNFASARDYHILLIDMRFWLLMLYAVFANIGFMVTSKKYAYVMPVISVTVILVLLLNLVPWLPAFAYYIRMYMTLAMIPYVLWMIWFRLRAAKLSPAKVEANSVMRYAFPVLVPFLVLAFFDINSSFGYAQYLVRYTSEVNKHTGYVAFEDTQLVFDPDEAVYGGTWTHPVMSLVLRSGADKGIILNRAGYQGYQGLDLDGKMPDISAYYGH